MWSTSQASASPVSGTGTSITEHVPALQSSLIFTLYVLGDRVWGGGVLEPHERQLTNLGVGFETLTSLLNELGPVT